MVQNGLLKRADIANFLLEDQVIFLKLSLDSWWIFMPYDWR